MTERNELVIRFSTNPGTVDENIAQVRGQVQLWLEDFANLDTYGDDQIPELKKRLADLRRGKDLIEDERKRIKKQYLLPLEEFESKVKTITAEIDDSIRTGKTRLDDYQKRQDEVKKKLIFDWWNDHKPAGIDIRFEQIWNDKFLNKTGDGARWEEILWSRITKIEEDKKILTGYLLSDETNEMGQFLTADYIRTLDLGESMANWMRKEEEKKRYEELARQAEEARKAREQAKPEPVKQEPMPQPEPVKEPEKPVKLYTITFRMIDIPEDKVIALNHFLRDNEIKIKVTERSIREE